MATKNKEILGYEKIDGSAFVSADDALDYALEKCGVMIVDSEAPEVEEFCRAIEEWYFSDVWVEVTE